jgi:hypothetical protein
LAEGTRRATERLRNDAFALDESRDAIKAQRGAWAQVLLVSCVHVVEVQQDQFSVFAVGNRKSITGVEGVLVSDFVYRTHAVPHPNPLALHHLTRSVQNVPIPFKLFFAVD